MRRLFLSTALALSCAFAPAYAATPAASPAPAPAKLIPVEDFFRNPEITQPRLAPDGKHLAFLMPIDRRLSLILWDLETGQSVPLARTFDADITQFFWKGDDRIVFSGDPNGGESRAIFVVNIRTKAIKCISEVYKENREGAAFASLVDPLHFDPDHILVYGRSGENGSSVGLYYINLLTADRIRVPGDEEKETTMDWSTDCAGDVRYRERFKGDATIWETCASAKAPWEPIDQLDGGVGLSYSAVRFGGFAANNRTLYLIKSRPGGGEALYPYNTETRSWGTPLFETPGEIEQVHFSWDHSRVEAIGYDDGKPQTKWFDPRLAKIAAMLDASLPTGTAKTIVSTDRDEKVFIIAVYGDVQPPEYFLLDLRGRTQFVLLGKSNSHIDPAQLQPMREVTYKARDGLLIHAYLTLPRGAEGHRVPLIVNPHGGPYGIRDYWSYNPEVQMLANRGYAVLQPNYRGSGGYGLSFLLAGRHEWGAKMQDDITDGVKWAIDQGIADPKRICIYGASYGGYAALAGAVFTPDLYCCAVNYVGVSDLSLISNWMHENNDAGKAFYKNMIGDDPEFIRSRSPLNFVERIRIPTLHAYGENDPRVDIKNWTRLERELKKYNKDYVAIREEDEGHGFRHEETKVSFYKQLDAFLAQHLKPSQAGASSAP